MTELLIRLTLLLLSSVCLMLALRKAEPTWRLVLTRSTFFAAILLIGITSFGLDLRVPVLKKATPSVPTPALIEAAQPSGTQPVAPQGTLATAVASADTPSLTSPSFATVLGLLWVLGATALLFRQFVSLAMVTINTSNLSKAPHHVQELWFRACGEVAIKPTTVFLTGNSESPHLTFSGNLVLPADVSNEQTSPPNLIHVLRHEAAHLQANDHRWFPMMSALTNLLWFHPLAWWLNARHLQACEDARDAAAARQGGADAYRSTIAEFALRWIPVRTTTPSLFRKRSDLKRRLEDVKRTVRQRPVTGARMLLSCTALIGFGMLAGSVVLVPQASIAEQASTNEGLLGSWRALNPGSDYLKQIDVVEEGDAVFMKIWHSQGDTIGKSPTIIRIPSLLEQVRSATPNSPAIEANKNFGFKTEFYQLKLTEKALVLTSSTRYTDNSGRPDRKGDYYFLPGTYTDAQVESPDAVEDSQGWLGYWKNKDRGSRGTLQLRFHDAGDITFSVWGSQGNEISKSPISRATFPLSREEALAGKPNETPIEMTVDHGFCKVTYALEMTKTKTIVLNVSTDYVDPKRSDQEHLWVFEPGKF